jgi:hypothetical protein
MQLESMNTRSGLTDDGEALAPVLVTSGAACHVEASGQKIAKTEPLLDSWQDQGAAVRRQPPTVKTDAQLLVLNG